MWRARSGLWRAVRAYAPAIVASTAIGFVCVRAILAKAGHPAAPLDDAFIHFQYGRRMAEGAPLSYAPGQGATTGATSLLWPALLAIAWRVGLHDLSIVWAAWALGLVAHVGVTVETARLARPIAGRAAAIGAGAMCTAFGAFAWFAWSGMETVPLAWVLMRTARVAAAWCEPVGEDAEGRAVRLDAPAVSPWEIVALGIVAPLVRPEGAIASVIAAAALLARPPWPPREDGRWVRWRRRAIGVLPLLGPLLVPMVNLVATGHAASSTAQVKWLALSPYVDGGELVAATLANARLLVTDLLDGGQWTAAFLPEHAALPIVLGAAALLYRGARTRLPHHAAFVAIVALGTLVPCTYLSFLWNRVRYIWPFAGAWFVMLACLARVLGDALRSVSPRTTFGAAAASWFFAGTLAAKLPWAVSDLAQSASAIDRQQVALARWVESSLAEDARVGVNDTGAIAYLGERTTFDVVGLTTEGESRYWAAGAGSRLEHYEKMPREKLPTHFVVYPQWMGCDVLLGEELTRATVVDQSILGGTTMVAYTASFALLGSGAEPTIAHPGRLADELDVADLESEAAHGYDLGRDASDQDDQCFELAARTVRVDDAPDSARMEVTPADVVGKPFADGGRARRAVDRFRLRLAPQEGARLVMRVSSPGDVALVVRAAGRQIARVELPIPDWSERVVEIPGVVATERTDIEIEAVRIGAPEPDAEPPTFTAMHYWAYVD